MKLLALDWCQVGLNIFQQYMRKISTILHSNISYKMLHQRLQLLGLQLWQDSLNCSLNILHCNLKTLHAYTGLRAHSMM